METTLSQSPRDLDLMVIVPRDRPARAATLNEALAGTAIRVVVDRRQGERRATYQAASAERRHTDRRGETRVVAYVYACPVVTAGASGSARSEGAGLVPTAVA
jgi:hypothetical protein